MRAADVLRRRSVRWTALAIGVVLIAVIVAVAALPSIVRSVAVARIEAMTGREAVIDRVDVDLFAGRFTVRGFRLADREGDTPLAQLRQLDLRVHLLSLLRGHVWIRDMVLSDPVVHVVRHPTGDFNISDLVGGAGSSGGGARDLTIDRLVIRNGTVDLEDRALTPPRTWVSREIAIEVHDASTRRGGGTATGRAVTTGAPVSVEVTDLRLHPVHLRATTKVEGLDATLAQVYLPPGTVVLERGRTSTAIDVTFDARDGLHANGTARLTDVVVRRPDETTAIALVPEATAVVTDLAFREGNLRVAGLAVDGALDVRDPAARPPGRFRRATIDGHLGDLTWPVATPGRLRLVSAVEGGGTIEATGLLRPPPDRTELRLRVSKVDLAPWAQLIPIDARVSGVAEADLRMNEALGTGIPTRIDGSVAVNRVAVSDSRQQVLGAQRVEARGLALQWPERLVIDRVLVSGPRGLLERDRAGDLSVTSLFRPRASAPGTAARSMPAPAGTPLAVAVGEVVVSGGAFTWRDATTTPPARLDVGGVEASVKGLGWPLRGPAQVRMSAQPPGGGHVQVSGRVDLEPIAANLRVVASKADLAPYQPYLPTPARIAGASDLDVTVVVPSLAEGRATVRGTAGLARLDVRDRERTVLRVERAAAAGVEVDWPERVSVRRLALTQPWMLLERDDNGALTLRSLMPAPAKSAPASPAAAGDSAPATGRPLAVSVAQVSVERGGVRVVDRAVAPPFAVDVHGAAITVHGLSTTPGSPARLELTGQIGPGTELALRGTVGALGGPLKLDVNGELREFAMPRTNPYLLQQVGWKTTGGRLTTKIQCRIDGDALAARTSITLSRLQLVRASAEDGAEKRMGLPLGMLTSLLKDKRGDIKLAFPVGGRLGDPRFDFSEAIWSAVRTVAINAITLPVSWIGRVQFTGDSKIERIEVNPVAFEPGTPDLTLSGRAHVGRLTAFLDQLPEVRMAMTPVVSSHDTEAMKRARVEAAIDRAMREGRVLPDAAAAHVFGQRVPGAPLPGSREAVVAALVAHEPVSDRDIRELADARLDTVRRTLEQASIDAKRLEEMKPVRQEGTASHVALDILEPEGPQRSRLRDAVDRVRRLLDSGGSASP